MKRRKRTLLLQLLLQLLTSTSLVTLVQCFNLDVRIPVIKTGGAHAESFFGYAVAQHRTAAASARGEAMVLVGAPQDENLQPGTTRSGALWKCAWNNDIQVSRVEMQCRNDSKRPLSSSTLIAEPRIWIYGLIQSRFMGNIRLSVK